jgi:hypothetical protein
VGILIRAAVREGLKRAFTGEWFDVTGIAKAAAALKRPYAGPAWDELNAAHCLAWAKLTPEERAEVVRLSLVVMGAWVEGRLTLPARNVAAEDDRAQFVDAVVDQIMRAQQT